MVEVLHEVGQGERDAGLGVEDGEASECALRPLGLAEDAAAVELLVDDVRLAWCRRSCSVAVDVDVDAV